MGTGQRVGDAVVGWSQACSRDRSAARSYLFRMVRDVQAGAALTAADIQAFVRDADDRGWPEVARAALMLDVVRSRAETGGYAPVAVGQLLDRAIADRDLVMTAMGLAMGAHDPGDSGTRSAAVADQDLARAAVLLESAPDRTLEFASAHLDCAMAYGYRNLWELELEHYQAAERSLPDNEDAGLTLPAIRYNRAEAELNRLMALREMGAVAELDRQGTRAALALEHTDIPELPAAWRVELEIFAMLIAAVAPRAQGLRWSDVEAPPECPYAGYVQLALALRSTEPHAGLANADRAVSCIDPALQANAYNLSLCIRAEIEERIAGRPTAGRSYARHLARLRWRARSSALASAQTVRQAERLRSEHSILSQHVFLDDLTQLGNRRALLRHLEGPLIRDSRTLALVLIDIDRFKQVNDRHGHIVGDQTLVRIADALRAAVRSGDLAVRFGGDEFLLLLPSTQLDVARQRAEAILTQIAAVQWDQLSPGLQVTVSAGVATGDPSAYERTVDGADAALYRAKRAGGNLVKVATRD